MAGSLLDAADKLLQKGIHPTSISDSFQKAAAKAAEILTAMSTPVDLSDRDSLLKAANTSLNSKVVSQNSAELSPIAVGEHPTKVQHTPRQPARLCVKHQHCRLT